MIIRIWIIDSDKFQDGRFGYRTSIEFAVAHVLYYFKRDVAKTIPFGIRSI